MPCCRKNAKKRRTCRPPWRSSNSLVTQPAGADDSWSAPAERPLQQTPNLQHHHGHGLPGPIARTQGPPAGAAQGLRLQAAAPGPYRGPQLVKIIRCDGHPGVKPLLPDDLRREAQILLRGPGPVLQQDAVRVNATAARVLRMQAASEMGSLSFCPPEATHRLSGWAVR